MKLPILATRVSQDGNSAAGNITGRDSYAGTIVQGGATFYDRPAPPETTLGRLYRKLQQEAEGDEFLTDYIDQLKIFTRVVENEHVIGLEEKLTAAGRSDQVDMAMAMKEMIYGQLREYMFSRTFQMIYATIMGKIFEEFETWVRPKILENADRQCIDELVNTKVVKPIIAELEECAECLDAPPQTVRGMLYFLTGNCHLKWQ